MEGDDEDDDNYLRQSILKELSVKSSSFIENNIVDYDNS